MLNSVGIPERKSVLEWTPLWGNKKNLPSTHYRFLPHQQMSPQMSELQCLLQIMIHVSVLLQCICILCIWTNFYRISTLMDF